MFVLNNNNSQVPVAHTYNPSYSGGRDQEGSSLKPTRVNSSQDPFSKKKKNPSLKRSGGVDQGPVPQKN
jgi:hypothetical protein